MLASAGSVSTSRFGRSFRRQSAAVVAEAGRRSLAYLASINGPRRPDCGNDYEKKLISMEQAASMIPDGGFIFCSGNAGTPKTFLARLADRHDELRVGVFLQHVLVHGKPFFPDRGDKFHHLTFFVSSSDRPAVAAGTSSYVPVHLHLIPRVIRDGPDYDAAFITVSAPDARGYMSLGAEILGSRAAINKSRKLICQVNRRMPRVHGETFVHVSEADHIVEHEEPLSEIAVPPPTEVQYQIAQHIVPLIPMEAPVLQLGIGGVPNAVLSIISERNTPLSRSAIKIHTEMISDGIIDAHERGALDPHTKFDLTFALGTGRLYRFLDDNPQVNGQPCDVTNNPYLVSRNKNIVAVNSALSVDLTGQVNADSVGHRIWSGQGGQLDFIRGASDADGGVPIIAFPSTARNGTLSRIVSSLAQGAGVVTTRADVSWVVTEYGAVNLAGSNLHTRAEMLISVAHPDFRKQLQDEFHRIAGPANWTGYWAAKMQAPRLL